MLHELMLTNMQDMTINNSNFCNLVFLILSQIPSLSSVKRIYMETNLSDIRFSVNTSYKVSTYCLFLAMWIQCNGLVLANGYISQLFENSYQ